MSNDESNSGQNQEQVPDLYRLLGLTPLESDLTKIQRALLAMQKKVDAAQKTDVKLAQRAAKVVALSKKNLLEADRKSAYDRAWTKAFGSVEPVADPVALQQAVAEPVTEAKAPELEWDLEELESYLPAEDPRSPFDLGGFLRYSASLPESNPIADYEKLQSFLGGTATATIAAPESISATALMPEYAEPRFRQREEAIETEQFIAPKQSISPQLVVPAGGIAKHIRRKRNRAMMMSVGGIAGALALTFGGLFFFLTRKPETKADSQQLAMATPEKKPKVSQADAKKETMDDVPVQGSGLPKVTGLDGDNSMKPNMLEGMVPENPAPKPPESMPANPEPVPETPPSTTPATPSATLPVTVPMMNEPAPSPEPTPEPPAADPELSAAEKATWSKSMKETLKTLGEQDFKTAKEQLAASEMLAKTKLQKEQLKRLTTVAKLTEEFHGFLVDAIQGLGAAETFKIGRSLEASFIEGNEKGIAVKIRGVPQAFALTELQIGLAMGLVDLKMDIAHPTSLARKAAFSLVHPKTNNLALKAAREQMAEAAAAGAVDSDMLTVFDEDYSLKKQ